MSREAIGGLLGQAIGLHQAGRFGEAEQLYNRVLSVDKNNFEALRLLGTMEAQRGNFSKAYTLWSGALELKPRSAELLINLGNVLKLQGRFEEALRMYDKALSIDPNSIIALNNRGSTLSTLRRFSEARASFDTALKIKPDYVDALYNRGNLFINLDSPAEALVDLDKAQAVQPNDPQILVSRGNALVMLLQIEEAIQSFNRALAIQPGFPEALVSRGVALRKQNRLSEALASCDQALMARPNYVEALSNRGLVLHELRRLDEALTSYERALAVRPDFVEALVNRGRTLSDLKRFDEALAAYDRALMLKPDLAEACCGRGNVFIEIKQYNDALGAYDRALMLKPDLAEAWLGRGNIFTQTKQYNDASAAYDRALMLKPGLAEAWLGRGNIFTQTKQYKDALGAYDRALMLKPDLAEACCGRGNVFIEIKQYNDASAAYDRALMLKPDLAEAWLGRGNVFAKIKQYNDALAAYDRALMLKPDLAEACCGRGNVFFEITQYNNALPAYHRAISLKPDLAEAWFGQGQALMALRRYGDAYAACDQSVKLMPERDYALGVWLHARMHCCLWDNIQNAYKRVLTEVSKRKNAALPFSLLSIPSTLSEQKIAAETYVADNFPPSADVLAPSGKSRPGKIRIGYFSADFRGHAVAYLIAQLFELHDRSKFEIFGFSFGPFVDDDVRRRLAAGFDHLIDVKDKSDAEIAELARNMQIDIGVDLMGFTEYSRTGIFAHSAAPIQVNFLGYPGTMGANYMDYIIADRTLIRPEEAKFYSEKIVYLPHTYQVNDRARPISDRHFTRDELGLPADAFVFCCFNHCFKITPEVFDIWMRLLTKTDGSVLWLLESNATAVNSLRTEAARRGIASERLVFAGRMPLPDHLARHASADLFLDTFYYNAHTTASDALWAGLPIVTRLGDTFAGRVAASLLNAVGLPELITCTSDEYEQLALELATDRDKLLLIKKRLADNRLKCPLFDTELFTKHIESAYQKMWERHLTGLKPDHLCVEPSWLS
jgi:predicted O-linked N-acetylglucosamine transferase (SPINDLY family)